MTVKKVKKTTTKAKAVKVAKATRKITVKKAAVKKIHAVTKIKPAIKSVEHIQVGLKVQVLDTQGKSAGSMTLPEEIFGAKENPELIAQAVRIYLVNQRQGTVATKTRGEVSYSTRKIYRQKGTGRARHGGRGAPIFVKGGVAHGPKPKTYALSLPKKMKRAALITALSSKLREGNIRVVAGIERLAMKTKAYATAFEKWGFTPEKRSALFVLPKHVEAVIKGARNLAGVVLTTVDGINTYDVVKYKTVIFMKEAVDALKNKKV